MLCVKGTYKNLIDIKDWSDVWSKNHQESISTTVVSIVVSALIAKSGLKCHSENSLWLKNKLMKQSLVLKQGCYQIVIHLQLWQIVFPLWNDLVRYLLWWLILWNVCVVLRVFHQSMWCLYYGICDINICDVNICVIIKKVKLCHVITTLNWKCVELCTNILFPMTKVPFQ